MSPLIIFYFFDIILENKAFTAKKANLYRSLSEIYRGSAVDINSLRLLTNFLLNRERSPKKIEASLSSLALNIPRILDL